MGRAPSRRVALILALSLAVTAFFLGAGDSPARLAQPAPPAATALGSVQIGGEAAALRVRPDGPVERILNGRAANEKAPLAAALVTYLALAAILAPGWRPRSAAVVVRRQAGLRRGPARGPPSLPLLPA